MDDGAPTLLKIIADEYNIPWAGLAGDGLQFFMTWPSIYATKTTPARMFAAMYLFRPDGTLKDARIDDCGEDWALRDQRFAYRMKQLGEVTLGAIEVRPFAVTVHNVVFGLIPRAPVPEDGILEWAVTAEPGNFLMFSPPWEGTYDT
jgi:hypothetical protein